MTLRVGLIQFTGSDRPTHNLRKTTAMIADAAAQGAEFVLTPEVTNIVSTSRSHQLKLVDSEANDITLKALRKQAEKLKIWLLIGSLSLTTDDPEGRFANRSFMIDPQGNIVARYDKMHMFDVQISDTETYKESAGFRPGHKAVVVDTDFARVGMTVCYDVRFPYLYRHLAKHGAEIITIPSVFTTVTGKAHWDSLVRARAIENGCFVLAPAQTGDHVISTGRPRSSFGHSYVVDPWGRVLADGGTAEGVVMADLDLDVVAETRARIPSLLHGHPFEDAQDVGE
jgi:predicted amidohydrolase